MSRLKTIEYLLDMCRRMNDPEVEQDEPKYNRWLGFIQGGLYTLGLRTIEEMKADNRESTEHGLVKAKEVLDEALAFHTESQT